MSIEKDLSDAMELLRNRGRITDEEYLEAIRLYNKHADKKLSMKCPKCGANSIIRGIMKSVTGLVEKVDMETYTDRLGHCSSCPFFSNWRCKKCTCWMDLKAKWKNESCPVGKW